MENEQPEKQLLFFGSTEHCPPCKDAKPVVDELSNKHGLPMIETDDFKEIKDINGQPLIFERKPEGGLADPFGLAMPTVCVVVDGKVKDCVRGYTGDRYKDDIENMIQEH